MAVTFTRTLQGSYDPETDIGTPASTTITGTVVRVPGNPHRYQALGLVESKAPTLLFVPTTYGQTPEPGDVVTWESEEYTVRDVDPRGPDGVTICARIIVQRGGFA